MCYEFESWHWKARVDELRKALLKTGEVDPKRAPAKSSEATERKRPEVKEPEKAPA